VLHIFQIIESKGVLGDKPPTAGGKVVWWRSPQRLAIFGIYYKNNPSLDMFQLKICLKTFETCSLFYFSVFKCSILAIILFKYY